MGWKCCWRKQQAFNSAAPRGLRNVERQNPPQPPATPSYTPFFPSGALMWELSSGSVSGVVWPFHLQWYNQDCVAVVLELYGSFINCVGSLLPLLLHFGQIKLFFKWAEITRWHGHYNKGASRCLDQRTILDMQCSSRFTVGSAS